MDLCQRKGTNTRKFIWAAKEVHIGHCLARVREESSWMTEWHLRRNFSSPWRVQVWHKRSTGLENSAETAMPKEEPPRRRGGGDAESRPIFPGNNARGWLSARRNKGTWPASKKGALSFHRFIQLMVSIQFQPAMILTSEATGVSEWIEQHIHPLSSRLVFLSQSEMRLQMLPG